MKKPDETGNGKVIAGALLLIIALAGTEGLLYHVGGLLVAIATPATALLWWLGYRLVTVPAPVPAPPGTTGNAVPVQRERPGTDQPHTW